jgi:tetratricopeptide (TPR) repeat protein
MKNQKAFPVLSTGLLAITFIFASCATTVTVQAPQPPLWNTLGIKRIAIMPFKTSYNTTLQRYAASLLTNVSRSNIQAAKRFIIVDPAEIQRAQEAEGNAGNYADAVFSGQVITAASQDSREQNSRRDKEGNIVRYATYKRDVQLSFSFTITRTRDAQVLGTETMHFNNSYSGEDRRSLKQAEELIQEMIQKSMAGMARYLAPYAVTERLKFERVPLKEKIIKERAKYASSLVKKGNYKSAEEAFLGIYRDTGNFEAGYNAGLLLELQGDLKEAALLMQKLFDKTGSKKAALSIGRLQKAINNAVLLDAYAKDQALPGLMKAPSEPP